MTARMLEVIAEDGLTDRVCDICRANGADDIIVGAPTDDGRRVIRVVSDDLDRQKLLDALQMTLSASENWRIIILPIETTLPVVQPEEEAKPEEKKPVAGGLTREELANEVGRGADPNRNFFILVVLSVIVAAMGLLEDNVGIVIGAMVIAPLLGPNLALAFASAVGDSDLMGKAVKTNLAGIAITLSLTAAIGFALTPDFTSEELMSRTRVDLDSLAVALASGAAAALSLTTGLSATLVGVMVAVALLPPAATVGIMLGWGHLGLAGDALLLLAVNVVCVNLAAQTVFLLKGIRPRTWFEAERAKRSARINLAVWTLCLIALAALIVYKTRVLEQVP